MGPSWGQPGHSLRLTRTGGMKHGGGSAHALALVPCQHALHVGQEQHPKQAAGPVRLASGQDRALEARAAQILHQVVEERCRTPGRPVPADLVSPPRSAWRAGKDSNPRPSDPKKDGPQQGADSNRRPRAYESTWSERVLRVLRGGQPFARSQNRRSTTKRTHRRSAPHGGQMQAARRNLSGGIRKTSSLGSDEAVGRNGTRMRGYLVRHRPRWSIVSATSRKLSLYRNRKRPRAARRRSLAATAPDSPKRRTRCCPRRRPCSRRSQC